MTVLIKGQWKRREDLTPIELLKVRISHWLDGLPFDWKAAAICWPFATMLIVLLILRHT